MAKITRFDRDASFYPSILIFIASFYVLFAVMEGHSVYRELLIASMFFVTAIFGAYKSLFIVGLGIIAHGVYDIIHVIVFSQNVAPIWWPSFCAAVDLALGLWVIYLANSRRKSNG
ncbi:hypothetical protein OAM69_06185 [bacterium]|nr:hypothetical protein [bacterium]